MLQRCNIEELSKMRRALNPRQKRNLALLRRLLDRSLEENPAFAHFVLGLEDRRRAELFLAQ
jgi:hypothetical protein